MIFFGEAHQTSPSPLVQHECLIKKEIILSERYYLYLLKKKTKAEKELIESLTQLERVKTNSSNFAKKELALENKIKLLQNISSDIAQITTPSEK